MTTAGYLLLAAMLVISCGYIQAESHFGSKVYPKQSSHKHHGKGATKLRQHFFGVQRPNTQQEPIKSDSDDLDVKHEQTLREAYKAAKADLHQFQKFERMANPEGYNPNSAETHMNNDVHFYRRLAKNCMKFGCDKQDIDQAKANQKTVEKQAKRFRDLRDMSESSMKQEEREEHERERERITGQDFGEYTVPHVDQHYEFKPRRWQLSKKSYA